MRRATGLTSSGIAVAAMLAGCIPQVERDYRSAPPPMRRQQPTGQSYPAYDPPPL